MKTDTHRVQKSILTTTSELEGSLMRKSTTNRWSLLPNSWKDNVDTKLLEVMQNNRDVALKIYNHVPKLLDKSPEEFSQELVEVWNIHNDFFDKIHPKVRRIVDNHIFTEGEIPSLLQDLSIVDQVTMLYSLSIKPFLEKHQDLAKTIRPTSIFHLQYPYDHTELKQGNISLSKILEKYHANSEELFNQRKNQGLLKSIFEHNFPLRKNTNKVELDEPKKSLQEVLHMDNYIEYTYLYNLIGVEGYRLKDFISTQSGKELSSTDYFYDAKNIDLKIGHTFSSASSFTQSTGETCGAAAFTVAMELLFDEKPSSKKELELYRKTKSSYMPGTQFSKIAFEAQKEGLVDTELLHNREDYFFNYEIFGSAGKKSYDEYLTYVDKTVELGGKITVRENYVETLRSRVEHGDIALTAIQLPGVLHTIVLYGYNDGFFAYDPLYGRSSRMNEASLRQLSSTSIGCWSLLLKEKSTGSIVNYFQNKYEEVFR